MGAKPAVLQDGEDPSQFDPILLAVGIRAPAVKLTKQTSPANRIGKRRAAPLNFRKAKPSKGLGAD